MYLFCQSSQKLVAPHNALITSKISIKLLKLLTTSKKYGTVAAASLPRRKISLSVLQRYNKKVEIFCIMGAGNKNYYKFIFSWNIERANL